jgi:hypothetical protein
MSEIEYVQHRFACCCFNCAYFERVNKWTYCGYDKSGFKGITIPNHVCARFKMSDEWKVFEGQIDFWESKREISRDDPELPEREA